MKKLYLLSIFTAVILATCQVSAQTTLTNAVDFTVTDVDGNVHNLFNILNNGQHVCIDFFFDTCGPCQATSPYFKTTYHNFGCNNEDIYFIAIDVGDTDAEVIAYENTFLGGPPGYPSVSGLNGNGNSVVTAYGIGAFPTYILIRPDQAIIEQDMWPIANATTFTNYFGAHSLLPVPCTTVGVNEITEQLHVSVYPNPVSEYLQIKSDEAPVSYRVFNMAGGTVMEGLMNQDKQSMNSIDVRTLNSGIYLLEVGFEKGTGHFRFSK